MLAAGPAIETPQSAPVLRLVVELPWWPRVFFGNLRDLIFPRRLPALELRSAPAEFWPDVFVQPRLPWGRFLQSGGYHLLAGTLLIGLTRFFAMQPRVVAKPAFEHSQVIYYRASEYLPRLDTRTEAGAQPQKADPEFARQPIISVPAEADNRRQTIVTPPRVRLQHDVALPNIVAWSDTERPQLEIPPVPLTPSADIQRLAPALPGSVVTPPPDAARLAERRDSPVLNNSVVAPPPELQASNTRAALASPQPALIGPPPAVESAAMRVGDLNIGRSAVIAPAPQLPVAEQRTVHGGRVKAGAGLAPQVVPPPPSATGSGTGGASLGAHGRIIVLNLHPAVGAPPNPPAGNRRGTFAVTPEGHAGATGQPGTATGTGTGSGPHGSSKENGNGASNAGTAELPSGLYVGNAPAKTSSVAGDPANSAPPRSVNANLLASARPPRVTSAPKPMQPATATRLSEPERAVFGNRKFYSVTLNMPNLNSAGGSWVIRFAELNRRSGPPEANASDLSQPMATRKVDPAYPIQLMRENVAGTVILYAVIHADGTVGNVRVLRGVDERLDRFATEAVAQWKFEPATKDGVPVDVEATFQIPFRPARVGTNF